MAVEDAIADAQEARDLALATWRQRYDAAAAAGNREEMELAGRMIDG